MRCRGLHRLANPPFLSGFLCSGLPRVAPYCAPGGVRAVSNARGLRRRSLVLDRRVRMEKSHQQPVKFTLGYDVRWVLVSRCHAQP
jgi:hypothetical protein